MFSHRAEIRPIGTLSGWLPVVVAGLWGSLTTLVLAAVLASSNTDSDAVSVLRAADPVSGVVSNPNDGVQRCESCHTMDPNFSHPIGVSPRMAVPSHLPLEAGRMACATCHDPGKHGRAGEGAMLRQTVGSESFCTQCHDRTQEAMRDTHATGLDRAHLGTKSTSGLGASSSPRGTLDSESLQCMGCHDGASASDAGAHAGAGVRSIEEKKDHPIGIPYRSGRQRTDEFRLTELSQLDPRIRLFDQTVGCGSCHSPYSQHKSLLVMSNSRSKLCLSCHVDE